MSLGLFISVLLIIMFAAFTKSAFGFGDGMVNMALLTQLVGIELAAPLVILLSVVVSSYILINNRKLVDWKNVLPLAISAMIFSPIGIQLSDWLAPQIMRKVLGIFIIAFAIYSLIKPPLRKVENKKWSLFFGGLGGLTAGAYSIAGPPAVIYATLRQWPPSAFRASIQAYFVPLGYTIVIGRTYMGDYTRDVLWIALWAIPALLIGIILGRLFNKSIKDPKKFNMYIYSLLVILGLSLLV